jgi:hypothetical protein
MAWRLSKSVVRGELENRTPGRVRGRLWLAGRPDPIHLDLDGDCLRDLAGCRMVFTNARPQEGEPIHLHDRQTGRVGDMTASRKVTIPDVSAEEAARLAGAGQPIPGVCENALYLEWFSPQDGRVVIEGVGFDVRVSEAAWRMDPGAEEKQQAENQQTLRNWLDRLSDAVDDDPPGEYQPDDDQPMDEFEWEKLLRESDALTDKYSAVLDKYRDHPDREKLVAREMGWTWLEEALEAEERGALDLDEEESDPELDPLVPNPMTEGVDWIRDEFDHVQHPLAIRASRVAMAMWHYCDEMDLLGEKGDDDVQEMVFQAQTTGAKLAGALNHLAYDTGPDAGFVVACLKRSLNYLHAAIAAADRVGGRRLLDRRRLDEFRRQLFDIRENIIGLMQRYRQRRW